ncbi:hypothetical protein [Herbaspirillum sp. SJZ099]|uniref:PP_RS20740 family protein n=1 Tax=Herbaspirillum sp. SJZ099 TaxID=2572916 RepID=UPI0011AA2363|nr:hypothetical protein [Herbaspirillum sp. SJZ099]TWC72005.1 hypothetical protein FB597_101990 [Herbaspirillum sp. SJZ099]
MQPAENGDSFVTLGVNEYRADEPVIHKFLPWHRPRKQFVRQYQWCSQIAKLLRESPPKDNTLKYLGLPGVDLLDLRHFHSEICSKFTLSLRFLGFNSSARPKTQAHSDLNVSLDEVRKLSSVDPLSDVIGDNFSLVAKPGSIAAKRAKELGPYDVINLDLCDGFGASPPADGPNEYSYYDAVNSLLTIQARSSQPWLLLLTTRVDKQNIDVDVLNKLFQIYLKNLESCEPFKAASLEHFAIETEEALRAAAGTPDGLLSVFLTSLCKWFLGITLSQKPPTSIELKSVIGYRVEEGAEHEDLISIALRFTPSNRPVADPGGLAAQVDVPLDEGALATQALERVSRRVDADAKLLNEPELNERMTTDTAALLSLARYDTRGYRDWLASEQG